MKVFLITILIIMPTDNCIFLSKKQISELKERNYVVVCDSTGKRLGSGNDLTPKFLYLYFDYFKFFPVTKEIEIKGGACSILNLADTVYDKNIKIIKAKNSNDTLYAIKYLNEKINSVNKTGRFHFRTSVDSISRLYFVGGYTRVFEYNIPKLLKLK